MNSPAELQARLWAAFGELPKPVDGDAVIACAEKILPGKSMTGFREWFAKNTDYLLGRLNG